ncbi:MAG: hypothetical protein LQ340_004051 [Diploschistes diacapsis]|nr:MAG: hypothetical protein LQ340_004051 [Diploschistes diacapsis]
MGGTPEQQRGKPHERFEGVPAPYTIFTSQQKVLLLILVSIAASFSSFASNIYFPAIPSVADDLHVSQELVNLTVTLYLIFQGLSPTFWGALSDVEGRRITYICTFIVFLGACIGLAETKSYAQLAVLRCLQSSGSASTIAIGAGVIGDITTREERGGFMGVFQGIVLVPLAVGPILGGVFAGTLGWRAIFWFLTIFGAVFLVLLVVILPETLRALVGNGSIAPKGLAKSPLAYLQHRRLSADTLVRSNSQIPEAPKKKAHIDVLGPLRILVQLQGTFTILMVGIFYMVWQIVLTVLSTLFQTTYHLTEIQIGLVFLANGAGCMAGTLLTGKFLDSDYRRLKRNFNGEPKEFPLEQARLRTVWLYGGLEITSTLVFGWTLDKSVHMAVPIVCLFIIGWASVSIQSVVTTFLVDIYSNRSASATAALNLVRCLLGAAGTAAVMPCIAGIGIGWSFTMFSGIMVGCFGLLILQMTLGRRTRLRFEDKNNGSS